MTLKKFISNIFTNKKNEEIRQLKAQIVENKKIKQEQIDKVNNYWKTIVRGLQAKKIVR